MSTTLITPTNTAEPTPNRTATSRLQMAVVLVAAAAIAVYYGVQALDALRAAGLNGKAPQNGAAIKKLIDDLTDNWYWFLGTAIGGALALAAGLMLFGSQRAPDWLFRAAGAVGIILVGIPAILQ